MDTLPPEIVTRILSFVDMIDFVAFSFTSKEMRAICDKVISSGASSLGISISRCRAVEPGTIVSELGTDRMTTGDALNATVSLLLTLVSMVATSAVAEREIVVDKTLP